MRLLFSLLFLSGCTTVPLKNPTLPVDKTYSRIQFSSCSHPRHPQPIWSMMLKENPDAYIHMGDMIYQYTPEDQPLVKMYEMQARVPEFAAFRAKIPMIATWDDYDFGKNDGGRDNPNKDESKKEFLRFFSNDAAAVTPDSEGIYHSFDLGPKERRLRIVVLDTRYNRDALEKSDKPPFPPGPYMSTKDGSKTILGEKQWRWLRLELAKPAAFTIIVSSIQFIPRQQGYEKWDNFPREREKLRSLLQFARSKNLVIISGDRHHGEISQMEIGRRTLYEVTGSGINRVNNLPDEANDYRVGPRVTENNFGQIDIDWENKKAELKIIDITGKIRSSIAMKLL
jgi:alkaline phosphatase D